MVELLTQEQEADLIVRAQAGEDRAVDRLIHHFLPLVLKMTSRYRPFADYKSIVQEGRLGLWEAAFRFDVGLGLGSARMRNFGSRNGF